MMVPWGGHGGEGGMCMKRTWRLAMVVALAAVLATGVVVQAQPMVKVKQAGFKVVDLAVPFLAQA
jgi:hypothetical protein